MSKPYRFSKPSLWKQMSSLTNASFFACKGITFFPSLVFLSNGLNWFGIILHKCLWVNKQCNFGLPAWHLASSNFSYDVNAFTKQESTLRTAKWLCFWGDVIRFCIGATYHCYLVHKKSKGSGPRGLWGKHDFPCLFGAIPLKYNVNIVLVSVDGLSHTVTCPLQYA